MVRTRTPRCLISAICFVALLSFMSSPARAGLQDAINAALDGYESLIYPREFVAPVAGNDIPGLQLSSGVFATNTLSPYPDGPQLLYEPSSGNLTAVVPAVVIDIGMPQLPQYAKIFSLAGVSIDSRQLHGSWSLPTSTALAWDVTGPLGAVPATDEFTVAQDKITWRTTAVFGSTYGLYREVWQGNVVAAVVNFGPVLASGLTLTTLEQTIFPDPSLNYVDYYNHRGVVTFTVPLALGIIPEPTTLVELMCAGVLGLVRRPKRRTSIQTH